MAADIIPLFYDDREHAETILDELSLHEDLSLIKKRLKLGDYQLNDWLIERKTLPDLVQSLCNGRLFSQVARLAASPSHSALLIEGCTQDIAGYQIRREALIGALCSISINFHIPILRSLSQTETAKILYFCATQLNRRENELTLTGRKPKRKKNQQLFILQSLPEVGPKLASRLLYHFKNIEAVFTAPEEALIRVEGIGKEKARKIREALTD
ncbi:ERCC4 domain-containing protein [Shewanella sp. KJ2020]|uniref:ERCC4 domain-containing protein n=1 Tax=Shewanella sp. KJ2020 TaxID=2919172 RepID=UPI0020A6DE0F|nr:ERCC4 domain-containing protein [Shewanella sp. KJ2020]MCP3129519.1 helix-hairpin-helix domain-containing protein [Shewanella sp. KJ2020]